MKSSALIFAIIHFCYEGTLGFGLRNLVLQWGPGRWQNCVGLGGGF